MAKATNGGSKTRTERRGISTFGVVVEMLRPQAVRVHPDATKAVDALLAGSHQQQLLQAAAAAEDDDNEAQDWGRQRQQQQPTAEKQAVAREGPPLLSHLRLRDTVTGSIKVRFESAEAAAEAMKFAAAA